VENGLSLLDCFLEVDPVKTNTSKVLNGKITKGTAHLHETPALTVPFGKCFSF
jgi:hypothetical protein